MKKILTTLLIAGAMVPAARASLVSTINPLGRTVVSTSTGGNFISLTDFQSLITSTGNPVKAGVFDNENVSVAGSMVSAEPDYATPDFTVTGPARYGRNDATPLGAGAATSGGHFGFVSTAETWNFSADVSGEVVTHFGTMFSEYLAGADLLTVTVTFTNNMTGVFTSATVPPGAYQFVGFKAPAGLGIKSVAISELNTGNWLGWDDMAFAVGTPVPEPSQSVLGIAAAGLLLLRRRR